VSGVEQFTIDNNTISSTPIIASAASQAEASYRKSSKRRMQPLFVVAPSLGAVLP